MTITVETLKGRKMEYAAHLNGGKAWFGHMYRCLDFPRLTKLEKSIRKTRTVEVIWNVDGKPCESFEQAVERLNIPAVLTESHLKALAVVPIEFKSLRTVEREIGAAMCGPDASDADKKHAGISMIFDLRELGVIEYGKDPSRSDGQPWADSVPEHMRWSPTVKRREQSDV